MNKRMSLFLNFLIILIISFGLFCFFKSIYQSNTLKAPSHTQSETYYNNTTNATSIGSAQNFRMPLFNFSIYHPRRIHHSFFGGTLLFKLVTLTALFIIIILFIYFCFF